MKKALLGVCFFYGSVLFANLTYDPVSHAIYTLPMNKDINQEEYRMLVIHCWQIQENIKVVNSGIYPSNKDLLEQFISYLNQVGSPAAKRLIEDLKKDKIFYPNGSVMNKIFT